MTPVTSNPPPAPSAPEEPQRPAPFSKALTQLRRAAAAVEHRENLLMSAVEDGLRLGLPRDWLERYADMDRLPGRYDKSEYGRDAALTWHAQEYKVRTGRLKECDPALIAEALEGEATDDGRRWMRTSLRDILFVLAWPRRSYGLHVMLGMAVERLATCFTDSPSAFLHLDVPHTWARARSRIVTFDPILTPPDDSPWPTLYEIANAAEQRLREGSEMERRIVRGEPVPSEYRYYLR